MADVMRPADELLHPDHDLAEAYKRFQESDMAMLPVVDGDEVVGVLSGRIVLRYLSQRSRQPAEGQGEAAEAHVRDHMDSSVPICRPDETLAEVADVLDRESRPGLLVVDDSDQLIGIISRADLAIAGFTFRRADDEDLPPEATAHAVKSATRARGDRPGRLKSYDVKPRVRR